MGAGSMNYGGKGMVQEKTSMAMGLRRPSRPSLPLDGPALRMDALVNRRT